MKYWYLCCVSDGQCKHTAREKKMQRRQSSVGAYCNKFGSLTHLPCALLNCQYNWFELCSQSNRDAHTLQTLTRLTPALRANERWFWADKTLTRTRLCLLVHFILLGHFIQDLCAVRSNALCDGRWWLRMHTVKGLIFHQSLSVQQVNGRKTGEIAHKVIFTRLLLIPTLKEIISLSPPMRFLKKKCLLEFQPIFVFQFLSYRL